MYSIIVNQSAKEIGKEELFQKILLNQLDTKMENNEL